LWLGRELLGTGDLEDLAADGRFGAPTGWRFRPDGGRIVADAGGLALAICRSGMDRDTATATSDARFPLPPGGAVSLCGCWRGEHGAVGAARLSFHDTLAADAAPLDDREVVSGASPAEWSCFCRAAAGPEGARYAAVRLSHTPSADGNACIRFDRLRLVAWEAQATLAVTLPLPNQVSDVRVTGVGGVSNALLGWSIATVEFP
jgi:hypothetical protein